MTTIRTTCPRCGEVDMGPESILLSVQQGGSEGTYSFTCPMCASDVEKRADRKIVALLVSAGVGVAGGEGGGEGGTHLRTDPIFDYDDLESESLAGPTFTYDDVIDFHFLLADDRYIEDFLAKQ
jgi:predicted RNA-binding Zn-ribbon protein involved in translation (DUF1610 family)